MDFTFTDEQRMFRDTVYRFAKEEIAPLSEEADLHGDQAEIFKKMAIPWAFWASFPGYGGSGVTRDLLPHERSDGTCRRGRRPCLAWGRYLCARHHHGGTMNRSNTFPNSPAPSGSAAWA